MDAARIMDEVLQLYSHKLDGKQIRVTRRYRGNSHISGYAGEVRQLLTNFLVNAVDAVESGGALHVRVQGGRQWSDGQQGVRITLADDGSGIPYTSLARIFEPFYTTKKDAGTGLGLWVSRGIVEKHGGSIRVRSQVTGQRRGTAFSIFLPNGSAAGRIAPDRSSDLSDFSSRSLIS
jgi:signal transduction histidine kinase